MGTIIDQLAAAAGQALVPKGFLATLKAERDNLLHNLARVEKRIALIEANRPVQEFLALVDSDARGDNCNCPACSAKKKAPQQ